jgi:phosphatidylglycerophosphate synthase
MTVPNPESDQKPETQATAEYKSAKRPRPSFKDIRSLQPPPMSEGYIGFFYRELSLPITWFLVQTPITANQISLFWILVSIVGICLLATGNYTAAIFGALCLEFVILLDRADGDVARYKDERTLVGRFIDLAGHTIIKSTLFIGVSLGVYWAQPRLWVLLLGISAALALSVGDTLRFYKEYLMKQNNLTVERPPPAKNLLHKIVRKSEHLWWTLGLYAVVFVGAITNSLYYVLIFYGITTPLWALVVFMRTTRELRTYDSNFARMVPSRPWIKQ